MNDKSQSANKKALNAAEFIRRMQETKRRRDAVQGAAEKARKSIAARQQFVPIHRIKTKEVSR